MAAWRRRFSVRSFRSLFQRHRRPVRPLMREACCPLSFPFSKFSASSDCFFSRSWLPVVLVGADSVLLLAVLGGLLHCVHDLAVLLGEGHDPERDQLSELLLVIFKYLLQGWGRGGCVLGEFCGVSGLKPVVSGKRALARSSGEKGKCLARCNCFSKVLSVKQGASVSMKC